MLCRACCDDTNVAYELKKRCLASDASLRHSIELRILNIDIREEPNFEKIMIKTERGNVDVVQQVAFDTSSQQPDKIKK